MSKPMTTPVRHTFTMKMEKVLLMQLQDKAMKESMKRLEPVSTADLVLKAIANTYPELFRV